MKEVGREVPLELSSQVAPTMREISRANATVVQAYASAPARKQLFRIEEELKKIGYAHSLKTVLGYGGITNIRYPRLFEAAMSGPVGGLMGARYLSTVIGEQNIVCSDVGGTSFDAGAITAGVVPIDREPGFQDMYVNVPMLDITSIGAGTGHLHPPRSADQPHQARPRLGGRHPGPDLHGGGQHHADHQRREPAARHPERAQLPRRQGPESTRTSPTSSSRRRSPTRSAWTSTTPPRPASSCST